MPDISHKVLTATLRVLENEGLISRKIYPEIPPRVEYSISSHGETVRPLIEAVRAWGRKHLEWKYLENERAVSPDSTTDSTQKPRKKGGRGLHGEL